MQRPAKTLIALTAVLALYGCSTNPLNIPDEEWSAMSQSQRMSAYEQQAKLDKAEIEAKSQERQAEIAAEARKQELMFALRQNARYGDWIQCVLEPVTVKYFGNWEPARPVAFDLVRGETQTIELHSMKGRYSNTAWVNFDDAGQSVSICSSRGLNECSELLGTSRDLHHGLRRSIDIDDVMKGALRCDLRPVH